MSRVGGILDKAERLRAAGWAQRALVDPRDAYWSDPLHPERDLSLDDALDAQADRERYALEHGTPAAGGAAILTHREAAALSRVVIDSLLLAAGLDSDEIASIRRKLRVIAADAHDNG